MCPVSTPAPVLDLAEPAVLALACDLTALRALEDRLRTLLLAAGVPAPTGCAAAVPTRT